MYKRQEELNGDSTIMNESLQLNGDMTVMNESLQLNGDTTVTNETLDLTGHMTTVNDSSRCCGETDGETLVSKHVSRVRILEIQKIGPLKTSLEINQGLSLIHI